MLEGIFVTTASKDLIYVHPSASVLLRRVDRGFRHRLSHPAVVVVHPAAPLKPAPRLRPVVLLDCIQGCPVDLRLNYSPVTVVVLERNRSWERVTKLEDLRNVPIQKLLPEILVRAGLYLPPQQQVLGYVG